MERGKMQVLFNYMPARTFDYDGGSWICEVTTVDGEPASERVNRQRLLQLIRDYVRRWAPSRRIGFSDHYSDENFEFIEPKTVRFSLFPMVFRCLQCRRVYWYADLAELERKNPQLQCHRNCRSQGALRQIYHVFIHECGNLAQVEPPRACPKCGSWDHLALDERRSQKARDFRWSCLNCRVEVSPVIRQCTGCHLQSGGKAEWMRVVPHRSNVAYYPHHVRVIDVAHTTTGDLADRDRKAVDQYLGVSRGDSHEEVLAEYRRQLAQAENPAVARFLEEQIERLSGAGGSEIDYSGIREGIYQTLTEFLAIKKLRIRDMSRAQEILERRSPGLGQGLEEARTVLSRCGFDEPLLIEDLPITTAVFGYTRASFEPTSTFGDREIQTVIRAFRRSVRGRTPIYTDRGEAEAILFRLNPIAVMEWLAANGIGVGNAADSEQSARLWLLKNVGAVDRFSQVDPEDFKTFLVMSLIHTLSHVFIKAAARITGFDRGGMAEYLFPEAVSFIIYSNRTDFSIGGMHTLFEQQLKQLFLLSVQDSESRSCVYDPLCRSSGASCHACLHLPETSCSHFNRNLTRTALYGGTFHGRTIRGFWQVAGSLGMAEVV